MFPSPSLSRISSSFESFYGEKKKKEKKADNGKWFCCLTADAGNGGKERCQSDREWEPSEKQLMHSQSLRQYFVDNCFDSVGALTRGKYGGRNGGVWRVDKCSRLKVRLMACLSSVIYWIGPVVHAWLNTSCKVLTISNYRTVTKAVSEEKKVSKKCVRENYSLSVKPHLPLNKMLYMHASKTISYVQLTEDQIQIRSDQIRYRV